MISKIKALGVDKKLILKVIAGILLLVIAFTFYLMKSLSANEDITINELPQKETEYVSLMTEEAILINSDIIIDVAGAVMKPSIVKLPVGSRVYEAIDLAGGLTNDADTRYTNLAGVLADGEKLYIPTRKELEIPDANTNNSSSKNNTIYSNQKNLININSADSNTLQQLTGVGPSTAEKIINYRMENGKFNKIEDIKNVSGIGDKTFEKFKNKITV